MGHGRLLASFSLFALVLSGGVAVTAAVTACLPDPKGDYQDFLDRTAGLVPTGTGPSDASFDSKPPTEQVSALYVGICTTALAAGDPQQALRFYTETAFTPNGDGSGKITLKVTPLRGWDLVKKDFVVPTNVAKSETRGDPFSLADVPVTAAGRFTANFGTVNLAGEANSVSGRDATITNITLDGRFGAGDRFCSTLSGQLTKPYGFTFDPKANTCLFTKITEGAPLPVIAAPEFVCPLE